MEHGNRDGDDNNQELDRPTGGKHYRSTKTVQLRPKRTS
eukprot:CAMPEP_0119559152 /NCGR_PEP_ID=MMETSP1352-20130426/12017_1 /TAXON_ID=265584 /ORGANISM="Stauroneis constricta, Strain CCMP1120" /LENGTH=38 /DNA_ID= /DNA_START= /DNA_END= /DNA_ORIENTATION=